MNNYVSKGPTAQHRSVAQSKNETGYTGQSVDNRSASVQMRKQKDTINNSPRVTQQKSVQQLVAKSVAQRVQPIQAVGGQTTQPARTVTSSQAANMKASLVRMFGGQASDYTIDRDSGSTFNDNNGRDTTGHHGVTVTDRHGKTYSCDFHDNGRYYTRG